MVTVGRRRTPSSQVQDRLCTRTTRRRRACQFLRASAILLWILILWTDWSVDMETNSQTPYEPPSAAVLSSKRVVPPHVNQAKCPSLLDESYQLRGVKTMNALQTNDATTTHSTSLLSPEYFQTNGGKPYFILHIGPSKTGTTTLQKDSVRLQEEMLLQRDRYIYLGRYAPRSLRYPANIGKLFAKDDCFQQVRTLVVQQQQQQQQQQESHPPTRIIWPECWRNRTHALFNLYQSRNVSVIISDEQLSYERQLVLLCNDPWYLPTLKAALFSGWNVVVVATYRRYAEWLLSVSKEFNQKTCHNWNLPEGQWNGSKCVSLWRLINTYRSTTTGDAFSYMNLDVTVPIWRRHGIPVQILNLHHDEKSLTTSFYCHLVPNATHTCDSFQNKDKRHWKATSARNETRENVQSVMTTAYNDIAYDAFQAGLLLDVAQTRPRQEFVAELERQGSSMKLELSDLPLQCPRQVALKELLQKSLRLERVLLGGVDEEQRLEAHVRAVRRLADEQKAFCQVDTQQLLRGKTSWAQVMEYLQRLAGKSSSVTIN